MIRIDIIWLALGASDLRGGIDALLAQVVRGFALGTQAHHAYVFANRRADRLKVLVYDGTGMEIEQTHCACGQPFKRMNGFGDDFFAQVLEPLVEARVKAKLARLG